MEGHVLHGRFEMVQIVLIEWLPRQSAGHSPARVAGHERRAQGGPGPLRAMGQDGGRGLTDSSSLCAGYLSEMKKNLY